jgi:predicted helicase
MGRPSPPQLRTAQQNALDTIRTFLSTPNERKGLVRMFCGTGKSLVMYHLANRSNTAPFSTSSSSLSVIVAPTIALITQFALDYVIKYHVSQRMTVLCICSENEIPRAHASYAEIEYTTNKAQIGIFLKNSSGNGPINTTRAAAEGGVDRGSAGGGCSSGINSSSSSSSRQRPQKVVLVTYQSLPTFLSVVIQSGTQIDLCMFDEAHHVTGPEVGCVSVILHALELMRQT